MIWYPVIPREIPQELRKSLLLQTNPATAGPVDSKIVIIIYIGHDIDQGVNHTWMAISIKILPVDVALSSEKWS